MLNWTAAVVTSEQLPLGKYKAMIAKVMASDQ